MQFGIQNRANTRQRSLAFLLIAAVMSGHAHAAVIKIPGPPGSGRFGQSVTILPNGNIIVTDPEFDLPNAQDAGAVYLLDRYGTTLSVLTGSYPSDNVGRVTVLASGNAVVSSTGWNGGRGAVTFFDAYHGVGSTAIVDASNSLLGSTPGDLVGLHITPLPNGNYVATSSYWDGPGAPDAGAATWGSGTSATVGPVSAQNSLVGSSPQDQVGIGSVTPLKSGHYVVGSRWGLNGALNVGAATWGNGLGGTVGHITASNSIIGSQHNDYVGQNIVALANGHYVVGSPNWKDANAIPTAIPTGAATWGDGFNGTTGVVSKNNSVIGSHFGDNVGAQIHPLTNGNYVIGAFLWDNGPAQNAGAVRWCSGQAPTSGSIDKSNALVGSAEGDLVGLTVIALTNGNYVTMTPWWTVKAANVGAVTWGNGKTGSVGVVSPANSLVGSQPLDLMGGLTPLKNGNYVVNAFTWDNGAKQDAGAVTWGNGKTGGTVGPITTGNSLVGTSADDRVGTSIIALQNDHYVVGSSQWDNNNKIDAGAVTWGNGTGGTVGPVTPGNSLVGTESMDRVGTTIVGLTNGNFVVGSPEWDGNVSVDVGAATWGSGYGATVGHVTSINSLTGSSGGDGVGTEIVPLLNGHYAVLSPTADVVHMDAGAVTWGNGNIGISGPINATNSTFGDGVAQFIGYPAPSSPEPSWRVHLDGTFSIFSQEVTTRGFGAVTLFNGSGATVGPLSAASSVFGALNTSPVDLKNSRAYSAAHSLMVVGDPKANVITLVH